MNVTELKNKVTGGYQISKKDALLLAGAELEELCRAADKVRLHFCGNRFDMCSIINAKSGRCPEDCKYCAQSAHYETALETYPLLDEDTVINAALKNQAKGVLRFSAVTSGDSLTDSEVGLLCKMYAGIKNVCAIGLCSSNGLLSYDQFARLRQSGVERYHCNLETSRRYFPYICSTHTYEDKLSTIRLAQRAGMEVCSGGIIGMGETMEDRIDMALELRGLGIKSVPLNILNPIPKTPFEKLNILHCEEVRRTVAVYRFILPDSAIRLAGGRNLMQDKGKSIFLSGANAAISGDLLTTEGVGTDEDTIMLKELGFEVKAL